MAIPVVVHKGAAGPPSGPVAGQAGFLGYVGERPVAVVVIEDVLSVIGNEEVFEAVVVVVAHADTLSPARPGHPCLLGYVGESPVAVVLEEVAGRFLARREAIQAPAIHQEDIEPAVVVVVEERRPAAGGFEQVLVFLLVAEQGLCIQASFTGYVNELHAQTLLLGCCRGKFAAITELLDSQGSGPGETPGQRQNQSRAAQ